MQVAGSFVTQEITAAVVLGAATTDETVGAVVSIAAGMRLTEAVAYFVGSAALAARIISVCAELMEDGAVYKPFWIVPTLGVTVHVTPVVMLPDTVALNWRV